MDLFQDAEKESKGGHACTMLTTCMFNYQNSTTADLSRRNVTLHHEMSRNVLDGHFHVFIFSESKLYAICNGENYFQIRGLVAKLHVFEHGGTTFGTFEKTCFKC